MAPSSSTRRPPTPTSARKATSASTAKSVESPTAKYSCTNCRRGRPQRRSDSLRQHGAQALLDRADFADFDAEFLADLHCLAPAVKPVVDVQIEQVFARFLESD